MTAPTGPLRVGFDIVDRLNAAALNADDMIIGDMAALFAEAATVIENLRKEVKKAQLATAEPAGRA